MRYCPFKPVPARGLAWPVGGPAEVASAKVPPAGRVPTSELAGAAHLALVGPRALALGLWELLARGEFGFVLKLGLWVLRSTFGGENSFAGLVWG